MNETRCQLYGLCLDVPFPVGSELRAAADVPVDVQVRFAAAPPSLMDVVHAYSYAGSEMEVEVDSSGGVLLRTPGARYHVIGGTTVAIETTRGSTVPAALRQMVLHYCVPALLNQRGLYALHANAVKTPAGAVVLAGQSGGGKSTLHAALLARDVPMLSDDVAVLRNGIDGIEVLPGMRRYRMMADTAEQMRPPTEHMVALGGPRNKVALWAPPALFHREPAPLKAIFVLEPYAGDALTVTLVSGFSAFRILQAQAYPPLESMALPQQIRSFAALVERMKVYHIRRPVDRWTVDELAELVLAADPLAAYG